MDLNFICSRLSVKMSKAENHDYLLMSFYLNSSVSVSFIILCHIWHHFCFANTNYVTVTQLYSYFCTILFVLDLLTALLHPIFCTGTIKIHLLMQLVKRLLSLWRL